MSLYDKHHYILHASLDASIPQHRSSNDVHVFRHHDMNEYGRLEVPLRAFLTSSLDVSG